MRRSTIRLTSCNLGKLVDLGLARTFVPWIGQVAWCESQGHLKFKISIENWNKEKEQDRRVLPGATLLAK